MKNLLKNKLKLNFGPQHPSAHGVVRLLVWVKAWLELSLRIRNSVTEKLFAFKNWIWACVTAISPYSVSMLPGPKLSTTVDVATKSAAYNYPVGTIVTGGTILVLVGCLVGPAIELAINLIDSGIDMLVSSAPAPEEVNPADMVSDSEDEDEPGSKKAGYSSDNESLDSQPGLRTGSQLELWERKNKLEANKWRDFSAHKRSRWNDDDDDF